MVRSKLPILKGYIPLLERRCKMGFKEQQILRGKKWHDITTAGISIVDDLNRNKAMSDDLQAYMDSREPEPEQPTKSEEEE